MLSISSSFCNTSPQQPTELTRRKGDRLIQTLLIQPENPSQGGRKDDKRKGASYNELIGRGCAWLAQSVEYATCVLRVVSSRPMLGVEPT